MKVTRKKATQQQQQQHLPAYETFGPEPGRRQPVPRFQFLVPFAIVVPTQTQINARAIAYVEVWEWTTGDMWIRGVLFPTHSSSSASSGSGSALTICTFTLVFIQLSLSGVFICPLLLLLSLPPRSSIIIFTSYIKIITESRTDRAELKLKLEPVRVSHCQGHPLCWRAFICQTIQRGAGSIYHDAVVSGSLGLGFNHFISVCPALGQFVGSIAPASACLELSYGL